MTETPPEPAAVTLPPPGNAAAPGDATPSAPAPAPVPAVNPASIASPTPAVPTPVRKKLHVPAPTASDTIPLSIVVCFIGLMLSFLGYYAYKNVTKPPPTRNVYPLLDVRNADLRKIPLAKILHAEKIEALPASQDSQFLEQAWVQNPPDLPEDLIFGKEGKRRHAITYTWAPEKILVDGETKETIPSLNLDWSFGAIFRDKESHAWPGMPLISKYAFEGDVEIQTVANLPGPARLLELFANYIYEGESTGLKVLFFVPETPMYDQLHGKPLETRIHAQAYLLRYDRYYALTEPAPTTIEPYKDFTLDFKVLGNKISLDVNDAHIFDCDFPTEWPDDDSYIGGVPGLTFSDGRRPHHTGYIAMRAPDFGNQPGKGYVKTLTIKGTPAHQKILKMRERYWWTDYRPRYIQQQKDTGNTEVIPLTEEDFRKPPPVMETAPAPQPAPADSAQPAAK